MEVILKKRVENLGALGDIINVKPGYATNYLIPYGKAIQATEFNINEFKKKKVELENIEIVRLEKARDDAEKIEGKSFFIKAASGDTGKLFGSIKAKDIVEILAEQAGVIVKKRDIRIPEGIIRTTGEFTLSIHLETGVNSSINLVIKSE